MRGTALDFGDLVILGLPAEVTVEVAFDWQERLPDRPAIIASLLNGCLGYLPHERNHLEKDAAQLYETVSTPFSRSASQTLLDFWYRRPSPADHRR